MNRDQCQKNVLQTNKDQSQKNAMRIFKQIGLLLCLLSALLLGGCGDGKEDSDTIEVGDSQYILYHVSLDSTKLVPVVENFDKKKSIETQVEEMLKELTEVVETYEYKSVLPENVSIIDCGLAKTEEEIEREKREEQQKQDQLNGVETTTTQQNAETTTQKRVDNSETVNIKLSANFKDSVPAAKILCKASIVKSLTQIEGVNAVSFMIDMPELDFVQTQTDEYGIIPVQIPENVETYTADSFVGDVVNTDDNQVQDVKIYFANVVGDRLQSMAIPINMSSNVSPEQQVIEELISGTNEKGYYPTIPDGTSLISVSTKDGVCYVDFTEDFMKLDTNVMDQIVLYSVVNSLCELPTVNKVAFTIQGEQQELYNGNIEFNKMFEHNLDLVEE